MAKLKVTVCFAPGKALSGNVSSGEQGAQRFGDKIAELPIVIDYLAETNEGRFSTASRPSATDWWDTGNLAHYKAMMLQRHVELSGARADAFRRSRELRVPDISTLRGKYARRQSTGQYQVIKPGARSEIYEIKPHNRDGLRMAREKLTEIEGSYLTYRLTGIYARGGWYPGTNPAKIRYTAAPVVGGYIRYLLSILGRRLGVRFVDVYQRVERVEAGVLLYRFCVEIEREESEEIDELELGKYVLSEIVFPALSVGHAAADKEDLRRYGRALEAIEAAPSRKVAARRYDPRRPPAITATAIEPVVDEIRPQIPGYGDALYSRMEGLPGQQFLICCDEAYYRATIVDPRKRRMQQTLNRLRVSADGGQFTVAHSLLSVLPVVTVTAGELIRATPGLLLNMYGELATYALEHPVETLIIITIAIAVTALVIFTAGTGAVAIGAVAGTEAVVVGGAGVVAESASLGLAAPIVEAALTTEIAAGVAIPESMVAAELTTAGGEAVAAAAPRIAPIIQLTRSIAVDAVAKSALERAFVGSASKAAIRVALAAGGVLVVGLSSSSAYAASPGVAPTAPPRGDPIAVVTGRVFLVPVAPPPALTGARPADSGRATPPPPGQSPLVLEQEFDYVKHTSDPAILASAATGGSTRAYFLGRIVVT
jgi:hypothetical protein